MNILFVRLGEKNGCWVGTMKGLKKIVAELVHYNKDIVWLIEDDKGHTVASSDKAWLCSNLRTESAYQGRK